ncbi:DUF2599 domain-containing protein [Pseudomonas entomophila]|uniref:DUF2599 domain-containing protein n=1 Tax=Pseudomonas entomophila TaxID=312306 RepID=UPI0024076498|nr:DUF2599 domain-containing protein [Pseudomonas entomophila]MDF9620877.1 DUF2599 domain-containing protein [Pseudomonas entomophila]
MHKYPLTLALLSPLPLAYAGPTITDALDPQQTAERINRSYNHLVDACLEPESGAPRGHYYCSGVTLRMVDNGNFNPWDYSPTAVKIGASSFTWIRKDLSITKLVRPAGFILRTPMDARDTGRPVMETGALCVFSFDGCSSPKRGWHGCGMYPPGETAPCGASDAAASIDTSRVPPSPPPASATVPANLNSTLAYGSCDTEQVDSAETWRKRFTNQVQKGQCSWNAEQPSDWQAMIQTHQNPGNQREAWITPDQFNEFLIRTASDGTDGSARMKYIDAFVYDPNTTFVANTIGDIKKATPTQGLPVAQEFQRKLFILGYAVPVLRMDFTLPAQYRFSYLAGDQVVSVGVNGPIKQHYIQAANWELRLDPGSGRQEWTLVIIPTALGKQKQVDDQQALYDELFELRGNDRQWREGETSTGSMRQQLACLIDNYPAKTVWNIEPFRPRVSDAEAAKAGCNPHSPATSKLIAASAWSQFTDAKTGERRWGLRVVPTQGGRAAPNEELYQELLRLRGRDREWQEGGEGSMRVQLACLQNNYRTKADWNLEPYRPAVSEVDAKAQGCNPV